MEDNSSFADDQLDPRIKGELDNLNSAAESINKLENEIQKNRSLFKKHKAEFAYTLRVLCHKIGKKTVAQAKTYYDAVKTLSKMQLEAQRSAASFKKASSLYKTAQETVSLAEQQLTSEDGSKLAFDTAWQEMLNHANLRFMEAEKEKRICEEEHEMRSKECANLQIMITAMRKDAAKAIEKSKPFYDMKQNFEKKLQIEKQNSDDLQLALICSKQKYKLALSNLEQISEEIHMQRDHSELPRRTPGVGAESDACSDLSELLSVNLDFISDNGSQMSKNDLVSDFHLDDSWNLSYDDDAIGSRKVSNNMFDNFLDKVGQKFQRSSSMGNLNHASLQLPRMEITTTVTGDTSKTNFARAVSRDSTLEGAEQPPERNEVSNPHESKTYTSTVFLPISYPIDKARLDVKRANLASKERRDSFHAPLHHHFHNDTFQADERGQKSETSGKPNMHFVGPRPHHSASQKSFQIDKNVELSLSLEPMKKGSF